MTGQARDASAARPNVVLVHCHDLGRHLGCYDRGVSTPALDGLADEGVRFDDYYCTAPQCSPSRASMHTGRYPHEVGMFGLAHMGWELDDGVRAMPGYFADAGYESHQFGFQHVAVGDPSRLGYQHVHEGSNRASAVADAFEGAIGDLAAGGPFFATLGITEPHRPFVRDYVDEDWEEYYHPDAVDAPDYLRDARGVREDVAALNALISSAVDPAVGRIVDAIDRAGVTEETLVVFTTDHGVAMPRAKGSCYDPGIETALIARHPGRIEPGTEDALLSNVDLLPTLLEYVGAPVPDVSGRSFASLLGCEGDHDRRERVYAELTYHGTYHPMRAVRTSEYKYVRNFSHGPSVYIPGDVFDTPSGKTVRGEFYTDKCPEEELYDLAADPAEQDNHASDKRVVDGDHAPFGWGGDSADPDPEYADDIAALRADLHDWMDRTDDPLLEGAVDFPRSALREPFRRQRPDGA